MLVTIDSSAHGSTTEGCTMTVSIISIRNTIHSYQVVTAAEVDEPTKSLFQQMQQKHGHTYNYTVHNYLLG